MNKMGVRQRERKGERKSLTDNKGVREKEREEEGEWREGEREGREGGREGREGKTWILTWYLDRRGKVREGQEWVRHRDRVRKWKARTEREKDIEIQRIDRVSEAEGYWEGGGECTKDGCLVKEGGRQWAAFRGWDKIKKRGWQSGESDRKTDREGGRRSTKYRREWHGVSF
jgi:hypothetical protein